MPKKQWIKARPHSKRPTSVLQFKITLNGIRPAIWRRIQVPSDGSILNLQHAIICAMGWSGGHLHKFSFAKTALGMRKRDQSITSLHHFPGDEVMSEDGIDSEQEKILTWFDAPKRHAIFSYDFGDGWEHTVVFEKTFPSEPRVRYPRCIEGARACPPEDCGGIGGYYDILEALKEPNKKEHANLLEWLGDAYDPEVFDATHIKSRRPGLF